MPLNLEVSTALWNAIEPSRKKLTESNYELATGIAGHLARIIDQQDEIVLSVEYVHLLETMALEDIPAIFAQFREIPGNRPQLVAEGNRILETQLKAILAKTNEIKEEYSKSQVTALKAKTSYITEKYALNKNKNGEEGIGSGLAPVKAETYTPDMSGMFNEIGNKAPEEKKPRRRGWFG